jgi:F0F1-type ATP synthase alpha subunit
MVSVRRLSVTRVGGVGHNKRQKALAAQTLKLLADYRQAEEFSHFGSELALEAKKALQTGKYIFEMLTQSPSDTYSLMAQQLMLDIILNLGDGESLDISNLKLNITEYAAKITADEMYDQVREELKVSALIRLKGFESPSPVKAPEAETVDSSKTADKILSKSDKKKKEKVEAKK